MFLIWIIPLQFLVTWILVKVLTSLDDRGIFDDWSYNDQTKLGFIIVSLVPFFGFLSTLLAIVGFFAAVIGNMRSAGGLLRVILLGRKKK